MNIYSTQLKARAIQKSVLKATFITAMVIGLSPFNFFFAETAQAQVVTISSANITDFELLKTRKKSNVLCQLSSGAAGVSKTKRDVTKWTNFRNTIRKLKRKNNLSAALKRKRLRSQRKQNRKFRSECESVIAALAVPSPTPSETATASPTATPSPTTSPTASPSPSASPTPGPAGELSVVVDDVEFPLTEIGESSVATITISNTGLGELTVSSADLSGLDASNFIVSNSLPVAIAPQASLELEVNFVPAQHALLLATLNIVTDAAESPEAMIALSGVGIDPAQQEVRLNCGGAAYVDGMSNVWEADNYFTLGASFAVADTTEIGGTVDDVLYQTERYEEFFYSIPVAPGIYTVSIHQAELFWTAVNQRQFNLYAEGQLELEEYDIYAAAGSNFTATIYSFEIEVTDGFLDLEFLTFLGGDNAKCSAIEVTPSLAAGL